MAANTAAQTKTSKVKLKATAVIDSKVCVKGTEVEVSAEKEKELKELKLI